MPGVGLHVSILVLKRGVCDSQSMDAKNYSNTTTQGKIGGAMLSNHAPPSIPIIAPMRSEVFHQND